jgi:hypothetical protein
VSGTQAVWPDLRISACAGKGGSTTPYVYVDAQVFVNNPSAIDGGVTIQYDFRVEFRTCSGTVLDSQHAGPAETTADLVLKQTRNQAPPLSAQAFAATQSLQIRANGTVWTAAQDSVTSPCKAFS